MSVQNIVSEKIFDVKIPSSKNYDTAEFRLWIPEEVKSLKGILVIVPGSNMDGRSWVEASGWQRVIENTKVTVPVSFWQSLARRHGFGLLGCWFTDKPHENMFIEEYAKVSEGSGQALLDALRELAKLSGHIEIADTPLAFWGISAGGQYNYEFACWKPDHVITFVLNKGGIYYTALAPQASRLVPGIFYVGGKDSPFRNNIIKGIYSMNRRAEALWTLVEEPGKVHEFGASLEMSETYFDEVIPLRLPERSGEQLRSLKLEDGYLGDFNTLTYSSYSADKAKENPTIWLPTQKIAETWEVYVKGITM